MNINSFFFVIIMLLLSIFFLFDPISQDLKEDEKVAILEIDSFRLYELDRSGLLSITNGSYGKRFSDYYEIENVNFTDKKEHKMQNLVADYSRYDHNEVNLSGNVKYVREDGLNFDSDEAKYDTLKSVITTDGKFHLNQNSDHIYGKKLYYNTNNKNVRASSVTGKFTIKD